MSPKPNSAYQNHTFPLTSVKQQSAGLFNFQSCGWGYAINQSRPIGFDIIEYAKENPLNLTTNAPGTPGYGDPFFKEAVSQLSDIPRPWTVPKMIGEFQKARAEYLRPSKRNNPTPHGRLQERCRYLVRVLAASRDSRAVVVLAETAENGRSPEQTEMLIALFEYYVRDYDYGLPPEQWWTGPFSGNYLDLTIPAVDRWWALNKSVLKAQARQNRLAEQSFQLSYIETATGRVKRLSTH